MAQLNAMVDSEVYDQFFAACKTDGKSVTKTISHYMREHVKKIQKEKPEEYATTLSETKDRPKRK